MDEIISLRYHHIDRFLRYYYKQQQNLTINPEFPRKYGKNFAKKVILLFEFIASGREGTYILVTDEPDSICKMCRKKNKKSCLESDIYDDSLTYFYLEMEDIGLRKRKYSIRGFLRKMISLYPDCEHV